MRADGDALRVLRWGLFRYAWIVVISVVTFGFLVPTLLSRAPDQYEARAQVGPTEPLRIPNIDSLPRMAESVFNNGAVADEVRQSYTPSLPPTQSVIPERVELVAAQDNVVFTVVGHSSTPEAAERLANRAASRFSEELNKYSRAVGSFGIQRLAATPTRPAPTVGGPLAAGLGLLGGLICGVGLVALLLVWRRPIVEAGGAEEATGAPVIARVLLAANQKDIQGLPQLCHRLLSSGAEVLLLASPHRTRRARHQLAAALSTVLRRTASVKVVTGGEPGTTRTRSQNGAGKGTGRRQLLIVDGPTQTDVVTRPEASLTLLVVREGITFSALRRQAEQYLDDGATGVVLVRGRRWHPRTWPGRLRPARLRPARNAGSQTRASPAVTKKTRRSYKPLKSPAD